MEQPRDDLLADSGRAGDEDATAGRRDALDLLAQLRRGRRDADQLDRAAGTLAQLLVLALQRRRLDRAVDDQQQAVRLERLLDEIVGADLDGGDR
jgi:hypothetical protein